MKVQTFVRTRGNEIRVFRHFVCYGQHSSELRAGTVTRPGNSKWFLTHLWDAVAFGRTTRASVAHDSLADAQQALNSWRKRMAAQGFADEVVLDR